MFNALKAFIAVSEATTEWKEFDVINMAFWEIDQLLTASGGVWTEDVAAGTAAINRWMMAELKRLKIEGGLGG